MTIDAIYRLLSARYRRYTVYYLYRYGDASRLPLIADQIASWETTEHPLPEDSLQIYNSLYHCHIPKLAEAGIVSYSQSEDVVTLAENASQLRPYLEQAAELELTTIDNHGL